MNNLLIKQPYSFRGFDVPDAIVKIDFVGFDGASKKAELVLGIYRNSDEAERRENRLDTMRLSYSDKDYNDLITAYPEIFFGIVQNVNILAAAAMPETFTLEEI
jgi:hypothetical protein